MRDIIIIENPSELGAGTRGASLGPDALKMSAMGSPNNIFNRFEAIRIPTENHLLMQETTLRWGKNMEGIVEVYKRLTNELRQQLQNDKFPLIVFRRS